VTLGGVTIETPVVVGEASADSEVSEAWLDEKAVMEAPLGLMGVTGRECERYQVKTGEG
jgi:hypothetical protein